MDFRIAISLLLLIAPTVNAESYAFYTGVELTRTSIGERTGIKDGLLAVGVDLNANRDFTVGFSFALQDQDIWEGVSVKGDMYAKYRLLPGSSIGPFVVAGVTAALLKEYECGPRYTNVGGSFVLQTVCESESLGSVGASYQVGASFSIGHTTNLVVFFGQFFGTNDVRMNVVGINALF